MTSKQLKKMMARKMIHYKLPHTRPYANNKTLSHEVFRARVNKKKIPDIPYKPKKDKEFANMSISEYEKKYL